MEMRWMVLLCVKLKSKPLLSTTKSSINFELCQLTLHIGLKGENRVLNSSKYCNICLFSPT